MGPPRPQRLNLGPPSRPPPKLVDLNFPSKLRSIVEPPQIVKPLPIVEPPPLVEPLPTVEPPPIIIEPIVIIKRRKPVKSKPPVPRDWPKQVTKRSTEPPVPVKYPKQVTYRSTKPTIPRDAPKQDVPKKLSKKKRKRLRQPEPEIILKRKRRSLQKAGKKEMKITENIRYLKGNFRGALQEYVNHLPQGYNMVLTFRSEPREDGISYSAICNPFYLWGATFTGSGVGLSKKASIHYAALDVILMMGLVTPEEHLLFHPPKRK